MMRPDTHAAVYVCVAPVDMRKQATTLALIVEQTLKRNIFEPALYVFSNAQRDRIKILYWQKNGLCLWSKRLEGRDRFIFPRHIEGETVTIRGAQLEELLAGFDLWRQVRISRKEGHRFTASRSMVSRHAGPLLVKQNVLDFPSRTIIRQ